MEDRDNYNETLEIGIIFNYTYEIVKSVYCGVVKHKLIIYFKLTELKNDLPLSKIYFKLIKESFIPNHVNLVVKELKEPEVINDSEVTHALELIGFKSIESSKIYIKDTIVGLDKIIKPNLFNKLKKLFKFNKK